MMVHKVFAAHPVTTPFKLFSLTLCLLLSACNNNSMQDLITYSQDINSRPATRVENLNLVATWTEQAIYDGTGERNPFEPWVISDPPYPQPQPVIPELATHTTEELEAYPLDTLRMVGTLEHEDATLGLVRAPDGVIHQVRSGNYLGENNGKVIEISESGIDLTEIVLEGRRWQDRSARLTLISGS